MCLSVGLSRFIFRMFCSSRDSSYLPAPQAPPASDHLPSVEGVPGHLVLAVSSVNPPGSLEIGLLFLYRDCLYGLRGSLLSPRSRIWGPPVGRLLLRVASLFSASQSLNPDVCSRLRQALSSLGVGSDHSPSLRYYCRLFFAVCSRFNPKGLGTAWPLRSALPIPQFHS